MLAKPQPPRIHLPRGWQGRVVGASKQIMGNGRLMPIHTAMALGEEPTEKVISIDNRRWKQYCNGLYQLPMAA